MSFDLTNKNGLIGFLTKKSLFTMTPNKTSSKRSNSK
jgi:hypothetical protein